MSDADATALLRAELSIQPYPSAFRSHPGRFTGEMSGPNFWIQRAAGGRNPSPSFVGCIEARDGGSRLRGHIRPAILLCVVYTLCLLFFVIVTFQVITAILSHVSGAVGGLFMPILLAGFLTAMNMSFWAYVDRQKSVLRRLFETTP